MNYREKLYCINTKLSVNKSLNRKIAQAKKLTDLSFLDNEIKADDFKRIEAELLEMKKVNSSFFCFNDLIYPQLLKETSDFPLCLSYIGNLELLNKPLIAIVGARDASIQAQDFTQEIANYLVNKNFVIVSGLAKGIDRAAHLGAGSKNTIAVIGNGINITYPKVNQKISDEIKKEGLVLSEYGFNTKPLPYLFPRRNRIISGLVKLLIVIEARAKSGSLITCREALAEGREILAVPGFPKFSNSLGCNYLIRDGANIFTDWSDLDYLLEQIFTNETTLVQNMTSLRSLTEVSKAKFSEENKNTKNNKNACEKTYGYIDDTKTANIKDKILSLLASNVMSFDEVFCHLQDFAMGDVVAAINELKMEAIIKADDKGLLILV